MARLHPSTLGAVPDAVERPRWPREALGRGIVHLGAGAFMRAHLAAYNDDALAAGGEPVWGLSGVSLRQADTRDALAPQRGLYTLALRDADERGAARQRLRVIGSLTELLVAPEDPAAVLARIAAPVARIVSLTVTEKGYCHDPATGALNLAHPDIEHDLGQRDSPRSAVGLIVHGLARRRANGLGGLTLMSLDNLPANGRVLRGLVLAFAQALPDAALADWIAAECSFPCSMVDRIVPRTTGADRETVAAALGMHDAWPVVAEPYIDWVLEDRFVAGHPAWPGVRYVSSAAMSQRALRLFVDTLLRDEVEPTLAGVAVPPGYLERLLQRFANPALAHRCAQIAMDGSQKIPQRLLSTVRDRLAIGASIDRLALALAGWLHFLRGHDESGRPYAIDDPLAASLQAQWREAQALGDARAGASHLTRFAPVFGDLAGDARLAAALWPHLQRLQERGVAAALAS